ncbi:hypothetical protein WICPIJ_008503 [Wickerhamomyces pijperi]|uniref:chitin deacetylase n=1 Tax=Wickerhamomyces pijperi TaxID=599730 RepID=A0A9P8TI93_WICPI|nr:hypothetical protein WICPIJ_008503 [Wickerhamomyces pijperi]
MVVLKNLSLLSALAAVAKALTIPSDSAELDEGYEVSIASPVGWDPNILAQEPFPKWLQDFTGLKDWPGLDPPYIPLDFLDLSKIPAFAPHEQGICPADRASCSFDCHKCVEPDDVFTCDTLSQTFDDGPSPATPKLIEHLKHKTTFFTLGINVVRYPEIYRQTRDAGHLMASHTYSHKFLPSLTTEQVIAQLEWSIWAQNATGNHLPKWWRPPYGGIDNRIRAIARQFGLQAVLWDYDTFDWQILSNQKTEAEVVSDVRRWVASPNPRGLILEHDGAIQTVNAGIAVNDIIGPKQKKASECVGGIDYIRTFSSTH